MYIYDNSYNWFDKFAVWLVRSKWNDNNMSSKKKQKTNIKAKTYINMSM
jgi:hypothetical protein